MRHNCIARARVYAGALIALSLTLAGCGGSEVDGIIPAVSPLPSASPIASAYAGTYRSTVALPDGKTGAVTLTVGADNRAMGTLTVSGGRSRQATAFSFGTGTYAISGTVDPTTGAFSMTGNIGGQSFSYSGTLPAPGNNFVGGSYSLTAGGQTYSGSFANPGVQPTPTPAPSPTPGVSNGGTQSLTFSNITGENASIDLSPLTTATVSSNDGIGAGASINNTNETLGISTFNKVAGSTPAEKLRSLSIVLIRENGTVKTGDVFDYERTSGNIRTSFAQSRLVPFLQTERQYDGRIGTVTVVSRTATAITVRVNGLRMSYFDTATNTANTFTVDGDITAPIK